MFVGASVSTVSAARGHYYSNPTNKFWELVAATGLLGTDRLAPIDDIHVTDYGIGLTDVVKRRAESSDTRLRRTDFDVPAFLTKIETFAPRVIAFNGKKAAEVVARYVAKPVPSVGPASWTIAGARVYRLPSSSAAAAIGRDAKQRAWAEFGAWVRALPQPLE